jgi:hypothetical protein
MVFFHHRGFSQCGTESFSILNQCPGQQPQVQIDGAVNPSVNYIWYEDLPSYLLLGQGYSVVYPTALSGSETFHYIKQITNTGGPTALPGPYTVPASVASSGDVYDMTISSTDNFMLNYITVAIRVYSCDASKEYRLKVRVNASFSEWHYFKCSDMINTSDNAVKLVRVPVYRSASELGLLVAAGSSTVTILTANDGTQKAGSEPVNAFEWLNAGSFSPTYAIGSAPNQVTVNYTAAAGTISGQPNRVPGLFDWNISLLCPSRSVSVTANSTGCCVPGSVNTPAITSSSGSNIVNTVPISPAITLSTPLQPGYYYEWYKDGLPMGVGFQGTNVNAINISDVGKYTVKVAQNSSFISIVSCAKDNLMWVQKRILFAEADQTTVCLGENVNVLAKGATGNITWSPGANLSSTTSATPVFTAPSPGTYTLNVSSEVPVGNQIINGDFEQGNVAINPSSYYTYLNPTTATNATPSFAIGYPSRKTLSIGVGNYTINEYVFWPGFQAWLPIADHTTGTGKFLYTDASGANQPGTVKFLWSQDVVVQPGLNYEFAAWVTNFNAEGDAGYVVPPGVPGININVANNPLPELMLYIDDVPAFAVPPTISATVGLWQKISTVWNSGLKSGTVKLKLAEIYPGPGTGGHDFGLDDISFGAPGLQTHSIDITVNDCNTINASISACAGDSVTITATTNGVFQGWTNTTLGYPSSSTIGIKNPSQLITKAKAENGVSTAFTATAKFIFGNEIVNGDFSQFNTGFSTTYSQVTNPNGTGMNPGQFAIGVLPTAVDNTFLINKTDHTTGSASPQYFIGDSRFESMRQIAYRTSVAVVNGDEYGFSGWFANIHKEFLLANPDTSNSAPYPSGGKTTHLALYANNQFVRRIDLPLNTDWHNFTATWTANTTGMVNLELRSLNIPFGSYRSGFVMDDLQFGKVYAITKDVTVNAICTLPVEFASFHAKRSQAGVLLQWTTTKEENAEKFIVQRSLDGIHFENLMELSASGNSVVMQHYSFVDQQAPETQAYYRILQKDFTSSSSYSDIRSVASIVSNAVLVYPNPGNGQLWLWVPSSEEQAQILVKSYHGQAIATEKIATNASHMLNTRLAPGVYMVEIQANDYLEVVKVIVAE